MSNKEKIESYMLQMEILHEELDEGLWLLYEYENSSQKLIVSDSDSIIHFRMKVMEIPKDRNTHCDLFRKLLEINATSLSHGAFAIEENIIVLIDSLQAENLDFNEFQASVEALFLGIIDTYEDLSKYVEKQHAVK
ncbi:MAG: hypothetical protein AB1782_06645 [Cyanobacteriota bacterium]